MPKVTGINITVSRGTPLAWPVALLFTIVGLGMMVFGWPVVIPMGDGGVGDTIADIIMLGVALAITVPAWVIFLLVVIRGFQKRRRVVVDVPGELAEPPSDHDPAVVAVLHGEGKPGRTAVAGTVLDLAHRNQLEVEEYGDRLVVRVREHAEGATEGEKLVIGGLRENAEPNGDVVGPPVFQDKARWWRAFRRDARQRATVAGLAQPVIPYIGLTLVLIFTAVGLSLMLFDHILVFIGLILFANGFPHLMGLASGYRLTLAGNELRARWEAFARYLEAQGSVRAVGPAAVAIWGPNLAYGVVLGQAPRAARPLMPGVPEEDERVAEEVVSQTWTSEG
ncbi:MAG: DUF2207 domain-containing protein [Actinobacteria bacterium]|nr:DUF2207 domain-containing protein [Actinomycetota bacterium]